MNSAIIDGIIIGLVPLAIIQIVVVIFFAGQLTQRVNDHDRRIDRVERHVFDESRV